LVVELAGFVEAIAKKVSTSGSASSFDVLHDGRSADVELRS
jgi:hypothetical protein